jgi:hypothetical protein
VLGTPGDGYLVAILVGGRNLDGRPGAHADLDEVLPTSIGDDGRANRWDEAIGFCARDRIKDLQLVGDTGILARYTTTAAVLGYWLA